MALEGHLSLSHFIKSTHENLRKEAAILGTREAWDKHCLNEEKLNEYARSMKELATNHWENSYKNNSKAVSRVKWVYDSSLEYFLKIDKYNDKEVEILKKINNKNENVSFKKIFTQPYKFLDVGSCYNPFKECSCFDVTAVDIAPASSDVKKCDFLNLILLEKPEISDKIQFVKNSYDIVLFSLLLEYFPSPDQRYKCCETAYNLLKTGGILIIITPDSNHVGANAKFMKSWRCILAKMGFSRVKYEKFAHIHCMVFRKAFCKEITERWAEIHSKDELFDKIYIPQDFKKISLECSDIKTCKEENICDTDIVMGFLQEFSFTDEI